MHKLKRKELPCANEPSVVAVGKAKRKKREEVGKEEVDGEI